MRPTSSSNVALLSLLVVGSSFALACTANGSPDDRSPSASTPESADPSPPHESITVERTASGMRHVTPVTGKLIRSVDGATAATIAFFSRHPELGLARPDARLAPRAVERDELGMVHVKMQQLAHGVPVRGGEVAAHYAADGSLASIDAKIADGIDDADPRPSLSSGDALAAARAHVATEDASVTSADLRAEKAPALTFLPSGQLVWAMRIAADEPAIVRRWAFVDAKTGAVESYDDLHRATMSAKGYDGKTKTVQTDINNGVYVLRDVSRTTNGLHTASVKNTTDLAKNEYVSSTNGTTWDPVGIDAHAHTAMTWDYFKTAHGRLSYDNLSGQMVSFIHYDKNLDNAFNQGGGVVVYGDGAPGVSRPNAVALDIVAHEITHGVTETSSGLVYQQQAGALNEAISDIFGAVVEHQYEPDATKNWMHSEDAYLDGKAIRDLKTPRASRPIGIDGLEYPRHMKEYAALPLTLDQGGVHVNSLVIDHTAYLMAMGGTNEVSKINVARGIGWENLAKVWYRANTRYFLTTTNFVEAAKGTLTAAKDLSLSTEDQDTIECAWIATGVLEGTCKAKAEETKPTDSKPKAQDDEKSAASDDEETTTTKKSGTKKPTETVISSGCAAASTGDVGSVFPALVAIAGILVGRRARRAGRV